MGPARVRRYAARVRWVATVVVLSAALVGCARGPVVHASYAVPATVPLRSFPRVLVTSGHDPLEIALGQELVAALQSSVDVWRVDRDQLEQRRRAGEIRGATLVALVEVRLQEGIDTETTSRPETVCGPNGCYRRTRYDTFDVPTLRATAVLTVYEGPTARMLQRVHRTVRERGRSFEQMRERVLVQLREGLRELVDGREERVQVRLLQVDLPGVEPALETLAAGRWRAGRLELERAARSPAAEALEPAERARLFYDLGVARRFDPAPPEAPTENFTAAEAAFEAAVRLHPHPRYAEALAALRDHRRATEEAARQREATERNFALERQADPHAEAPPPPPGYEDRAPL
tara:strand:- start:1590 stop:2633 length:1044 start_codon:yes stop_codon:yes gene_type:complete